MPDDNPVDCYQILNISVVYGILVYVTVASAERSFLNLKLLKNYLRSTMSQKRLNGLAMCTIKRDILDTIDLNTVLDDFARLSWQCHLSSLLHHATVSPASLSPSVFVFAAGEQPKYLLPVMHVSRCAFCDAHQEGNVPKG